MTGQNKVAQMLEVLADNGFGMYDLALLMRSLNEESIAKAEEQIEDDQVLESKIKEVLDEIPIMREKGYEFFVTGIKLAYKCRLQTGKKLAYLERKVAGAHNVDFHAVERIMKNALEDSWKLISEENARKFGIYRSETRSYRPSSKMNRPSNGMFVTAIADYLLKEFRQKQK